MRCGCFVRRYLATGCKQTVRNANRTYFVQMKPLYLATNEEVKQLNGTKSAFYQLNIPILQVLYNIYTYVNRKTKNVVFSNSAGSYAASWRRLTWRANAGGGTDIITYRKWEFGGISPTRPINMLLGIYDPTIIHDLQNAATYWKKVISYQTLEFKYLKSCFSAHQYKETSNFYEARR